MAQSCSAGRLGVFLCLAFMLGGCLSSGGVVHQDGGPVFWDGGPVFQYQDGGFLYQDGGIVYEYEDGGPVYQYRDGGVVYQDGGPLCIADIPCTPAGGLCHSGSVSCASNNASCVDQGPLPDGTSCGDGKACSDGGCGPACTINQDFLTYSFSGSLNQLQLGIGIFTPASAPEGTCVCVPQTDGGCTNPAQVCSTAGGGQTFHLKTETDSLSIQTDLGVSAEAAFDDGFWSGDATAQFLQQSSLTTDSVYLLLTADVTFNSQILSNVNLSPDALADLKADPRTFLQHCGDRYVSEATYGGYFHAIYQFSGVSESEKTSLTATFNIGDDWGDSASASFVNAVTQASSKYQTELWVSEGGGNFRAAVSLDPSKLITQATGFASTVNCSNSIPVSVSTLSYYTTRNWPIIPEVVYYPDVSAQVAQIRSLASSYVAVKQFENDIKGRYERLENLQSNVDCQKDRDLYNQKLQEVEDYLTLAGQELDRCGALVGLCADISMCLTPPPVPDLTLWPLIDPAQCGPICAGNGYATYESDNYGYCTRCTWSFPAPLAGLPDLSFLDKSTCGFMRPGASVTVSASGYWSVPETLSSTTLEVSSGGQGDDTNCDTQQNGPCCSHANSNSGGPFNFDLSDTLTVENGAAATQSAVSAELFAQYYCNGCDTQDIQYYSPVVIDICDTGRSQRCCVVDSMSCVSGAQCCSGNCVGGRCADTCAPGLTACPQGPVDAGPATPCVDLQSDPSNCGGCGVACSPAANAVPACALGQCVLVCVPGYAAVDGNCQPRADAG
jgi:hypothetical protein